MQQKGKREKITPSFHPLMSKVNH